MNEFYGIFIDAKKIVREIEKDCWRACVHKKSKNSENIHNLLKSAIRLHGNS